MKILLIGGTGTVGYIFAELLRDNEVIVMSRNENKQFEMKQKYPDFNYVLGDVRDRKVVFDIVKNQEIVIHLGAIKHVSFCEDNPYEATTINVIGTQNVIDACIFYDSVQKAIYFNTDKSIKAINTYGSTKFLAYKLWESANLKKDIFSTIVSGNVINSSGSVIEIYLKKINEAIKAGEKPKLSVNHVDSERYWITSNQLKDMLTLVLRSKASGIFCAEMPRFKIIDLVRALDAEPIIKNCLSTGEKIKEDFFIDPKDEKPLLNYMDIKELLKEEGII